MAAMPRMRRWTDPRDRTRWQVIYAPPVEMDPPAVRTVREGLIFRNESGDLHAPAPYGWDLESLTDGDLEGLLDQARAARAEIHRTAGWGPAPGEEGEGVEDGEGDAPAGGDAPGPTSA
jgi:hypothetical protein